MENKEQIERMHELCRILNDASKAYYQEDREIMSNYDYDRLSAVPLEIKSGRDYRIPSYLSSYNKSIIILFQIRNEHIINLFTPDSMIVRHLHPIGLIIDTHTV